MTIRRRLALTFLGIMILFAVNILVFVTGREQRNRGFEELESALSREQEIIALRTDIHDFQRELSLLSGVFETPLDTATSTPPEVLALGERLRAMRPRLDRLVRASDGSSGAAAELAECAKLLDSWKIVIDNFSSDHVASLTELSVTAEPLSQEIIEKLLPNLVRDEQARAAAARERFHAASVTHDRTALVTFVISAFLAAVMALKLSSYIAEGLSRLKRGAEKIGTGELDHRIEMATADELGALGEAINRMAERRQMIEDQLRATLGKVRQTVAPMEPVAEAMTERAFSEPAAAIESAAEKPAAAPVMAAAIEEPLGAPEREEVQAPAEAQAAREPIRVDAAALLDRIAGDLGFLGDLIAAARADAAMLIARLREHLAAGVVEPAARDARALRSLLAGFEAAAVAEDAASCEVAVRHAALDVARYHCDLLAARLPALFEELEKIRRRTPSAA